MALKDVTIDMMNTSNASTPLVDTILLTTSESEHCHSFHTNESITFYANVVALAFIILFGKFNFIMAESVTLQIY